jgi:hypothetical protein
VATSVTSSYSNGQIEVIIDFENWTSSVNNLSLRFSYNYSSFKYLDAKLVGGGSSSTSSSVINGSVAITSSLYNGQSTGSYKLTFEPLYNTDATFSQTISAFSLNGVSEALLVPNVFVPHVNVEPTGTISIVGDLYAGEEVTADVSGIVDQDGIGTISYQWFRDELPVEGATSSAYELSQDDIGTSITVKVSYTDGFGTDEQISSDPSSDVREFVPLPSFNEFDSQLTYTESLDDMVWSGQCDLSSIVILEFYHGNILLASVSSTPSEEGVWTILGSELNLGSAAQDGSYEVRVTAQAASGATSESVQQALTIAIDESNPAVTGSLKGIINDDLTIYAGQQYDVLGDLQLADNATITISEGAVLNLNGHRFENWGTLRLDGTSDNLATVQNGVYITDSTFGALNSRYGYIKDLDVDGFFSNGSLLIDSSVISSSRIEALDSNTIINTLIQDSLIDSGIEQLNISQSTFLNSGLDIRQWSGFLRTVYLDSVNFIGNPYNNLNTDNFYIEIDPFFSSGTTSIVPNNVYFDGTKTELIEQYLFDRNDSLSVAKYFDLTKTTATPYLNADFSFGIGDFNVTGVEMGFYGESFSKTVYTWNNHTLLDGLLKQGSEVVFKHLSSDETGRAVSASDALAALKIAVGLNPNSNGLETSPYQYIAADVNQDGRVSAADALSILKMAVGLEDSVDRSWIFIAEKTSFWNDESGSYSISRSSVDWDKFNSDAIKNIDDAGASLVAILRGDVNGSWENSNSSLETLESTYFYDLEDSGIGPAEQWWVV